MSTMRNCKDIFAYIESKQDILGKQELFARGKLVMLRTCNQLLRRLSKAASKVLMRLFASNVLMHLSAKANDVVFCGRILMFLAHFFPLSERSAVNIKGVFNTSNETKYEKDAPEGKILVCKPKYGGLGLGKVSLRNHITLGKWLWRSLGKVSPFGIRTSQRSLREKPFHLSYPWELFLVFLEP
ncbi:THO complex subunit 1 [Vitis vinifera]|uniref:THO complex subunit 1 n=1 Tax=Vitis vinifera TaxID=29760 RepID=A0A438BNE3_VITVI|nr:THO complex subunit 1 [Vitis vinifera]